MADIPHTDNPGAPTCFYLHDWYVDTAANRLQRGDIEVKLEGKMMAVLTYLAQHQGELVTREQLEQAVWGETIVGYDALTSCIAKLRKELDDNPREPLYIETISRKGYRLIAPIVAYSSGNQTGPDISSTQAVVQPARRSFKPVGIALIVLAILLVGMFQLTKNNGAGGTRTQELSHPSLVVLPFTHLGDNPEQSYFSDGMTADITTALSKLSGLFVIAQSSAIGYRDKPQDIRQVAKTLGVRYVLEGSVRRTHDRLRINVNLIDASTNIYLWSEKYDRELRGVFDVQDDITNNIVNTLSIKLTQEEKRRTARKYTNSLDAYDDFLRGQAHYTRHSREDNLVARDYYQQAIDRDADFARAYSAMALTHTAEHRYGWGQPSARHLDNALQLATKGVSINNELPQAHWVLGYVQVFRQDFKNAAESATRAIKLDPNFADSYLTLAVCRIHANRPDEAVRLARKAMLLNPQYPVPYASVLGQAYFFMQQYDLAVPVLREAVNRNINLLTAHVFLIASLSKQGQTDEATWAAEQLKNVAPDFTVNKLAEMIAYREHGMLEDIKTHLQRAGL